MLPTQDDIAYFLTLPDQVLINVVLPKFSANVLENLCYSNVKFNTICHNDQLWQIKSMNELPSFVNLKPIDMTWKDYYLSFLRPVYYHGDVISYVLYTPDNISQTIESIVPYIEQYGLIGNVNIVFIDANHNPYIVVKYPSYTLDVRNTNYINVNRIVLIVDDRFAQEIAVDQTPRRERIRLGPRLTNINEQPVSKEGVDYIDQQIIYDELISNLGTPPIYGTILENSKFRIIDNTPGYAIRMVRKGRLCDFFETNDLRDFLIALGFDQEQLNNYSRSDLCNLIYQRLLEIGHII